MKTRLPWRELFAALALLAGVLWLRWPSLGFGLWNVDEAIHATVARTLLDGGVLYRDAIDQRTPLSYYAEAGVFALAGENNVWAMRFFIALLIGGTAWSLFLAGRTRRGFAAGAAAGVIYVVLSSCLLYPGDAYAANTEWFLAFFSAAAAACFLTAADLPSSRRLFFIGLLLGGAFLSKQPALLELAAPAAALLWLAWRRQATAREFWSRARALAAGWLVPVLLAALYFAWRGAWRDLIFYSWTYNLSYYGPEIATGDRVAALGVSFRLLLAGSQGLLLALWLAGGGVLLYRLAQRQPTPAEQAENPRAVYLLVWSVAALAGAASGGRDFEHYVIQFLPAFALGAGFAAARTGQMTWARGLDRWPVRLGATVALVGAVCLLAAAVPGKRHRTLPTDPSQRVATYIREHSAPADRIFVWGYHPDIYLTADRRAASRFVYCSFVTGLIPWTNVAPERDTAYAVVPGALDTLLRDLTASRPVFIVDCSVGPNRHWQKYPPGKYPALQDFIRQHYRQVESHVFVPQGFRLYQLRSPAEPPDEAAQSNLLPPDVTATLKLDLLATSLRPLQASARHGASYSFNNSRSELSAHAPSSIVYRLPAGVAAFRGGYGIHDGAYAAGNRDSTDGVEFIVKWRPAGGREQVLLRRLLRPREEPGDRGAQSFRLALPPHTGGELELITDPGPSGLATSDWAFWSDLLLENSP